jgi:hypothetical protein
MNDRAPCRGVFVIPQKRDKQKTAEDGFLLVPKTTTYGSVSSEKVLAVE